MKDCSQCGASNATRAQFCNACGARFRVSDAVSAPRSRKKNAASGDSSIDLRKPAKKSDASPNSESLTPTLVSLKPSKRKTNGSARFDASRLSPDSAPNAFWETAFSCVSAFWRVFRSLIRRGVPILASACRNAPTFFAKLGGWLRFGWNKSRPLRAKFVADAPKYGRAVWSRARVGLAPSATWTAAQIPDFLIWGVVDFFLWRFPFSIVGIFYAVLANEAKRVGDFELARARAARAKGWLIADLALGLLSIPFRILF